MIFKEFPLQKYTSKTVVQKQQKATPRDRRPEEVAYRLTKFGRR